METKLTYCRICEALCGLEVDVENGEVVAARPDREHPISQGYCCVKGIRMVDIHRDPDRLLYPQRRDSGGNFGRVSWDAALSEIGGKVQAIREKYGPHSVAFYFGNPSAFSYSHAIFMQAFTRALGTRNVYSSGSQDCNNKFTVGKELFGSSVIQGIPDVEHMNYFLCLGSNPAVSQMSFVHMPRPVERLKAIEKRGGKVIFVGPRRTETSENFGEHVWIRPDSDVFFLASLLNIFARENWIWRDGIQKYTKGLDKLLEVVRPWTPARAAKVTGIAEKKIEEIARDFSKASGAGAYCSTGVNQGSAGTLAYWFLNALNLVSGNLDRRGGMLVARGPMNTPRFMKVTGAEKSRATSRIGGFPQILGTFPASILADEIETPGEGQIRALFVTAGNPVLSCGNAARLQKAFKKLDLIVTMDLYRNETGDLAHYNLPVTDFFQREDFPLPFSLLQPEPYVQFTEAVAKPKGDQRQEWEIYVDLAKACGVPIFGVPGFNQVFAASKVLGKIPFIGDRLKLTPERMLEALLYSTPARLSELKKNPRGKHMPPNEPGSFLGKRVVTDDGLVNLSPPEFVEEAGKLEKMWKDKTALVEDEKTLLLFSKREKMTHNTWMHNVKEFVKGPRKTNYAYLNPVDAGRRNVSDGTNVRIRNHWGEITLPAKLTDDVMPGAIAVPHGWGHQGAGGLQVAAETSGVNVNVLAPDGVAHTERLGGMTPMNGIPVTVEAVG